MDYVKLPVAVPLSRWDKAGLLFELVGATFLIAMINFSPSWFGILESIGEELGIRLSWTGLAPFIPWLTALWVGEIGLNVFVLYRDRWQLSTRWIELGLQLISISILYRIVRGQLLMLPEPINLLVKGALLLLLALATLQALVNAYRLVSPSSALQASTEL